MAKLITCFFILVAGAVLFFTYLALSTSRLHTENHSLVDKYRYSNEETSHPDSNEGFQRVKFLSAVSSLQTINTPPVINATARVATTDSGSAHFRQSHVATLSAAKYHHHRYKVHIGPSQCGAAPLMALVVVQCLPRNAIRRQVVRETWGRYIKAMRYKIIFLMGTTPDTNFKGIALEASKYKDILMLDFREDYLNLTLKSIAMVDWAAIHCSSAAYLVKVDDDVFIYIDELHALLKSRASYKRQILGMQAKNYVPFRDNSSKWYMPYEVYSETFYPTFTYGPCYVLSFDMLSEIHRISQTLVYIPYEDVFVTGFCASWIPNVTRYHSDTFVQTQCGVAQTVVVHWFTCTKKKQVELRDLFSGKVSAL